MKKWLALFVDDDALRLTILRQIFFEFPVGNLEVEYKQTAQDAIDFLSTRKVDLLFTDYILPDNDGLAVISAYRQREKSAVKNQGERRNVFLYTAANREETEAFISRYPALQPVTVISAPISIVEFLSLIKNHFTGNN